MSKAKTYALCTLVAIAAAGIVWWDQHTRLGLRAPADAQAAECSATPLNRFEAVRQAQARLAKFSASLGLRQHFSQSSARFDDDSRSWIVTFRNPSCTVMMVVDPCKPDDLGGTTDCHAG